MKTRNKKQETRNKKQETRNILLVTWPDQPNLTSLAICLAPVKKAPNRQKQPWKAIRKSLKEKKGQKGLGLLDWPCSLPAARPPK